MGVPAFWVLLLIWSFVDPIFAYFYSHMMIKKFRFGTGTAIGVIFGIYAFLAMFS